MIKHVRLVLICIVCSIFSLSICSFATPQEGVKEQLIKKGFSEDTINILSPLCQENLNRRLPADVIWYATFDRDAKSVTVDFQTKENAHNSITVVSVKDEGCMVVQQTIFVTKEACKPAAEGWINSLKKRGLNVKIQEENNERIYLGSEGNLGIKVYIYPMGNLCMQVFRNVESIKKTKK
jgi:hypothetical protein